jgi:hypothetical protein
VSTKNLQIAAKMAYFKKLGIFFMRSVLTFEKFIDN